MIVKTADTLQALAREILLKGGADEHNADIVAEHLVSANLSGVDTHGVWHLPHYVKGMQAGEIVGTARPEILNETAASALVKGNWAFGHVTAKYAMETAIEKAKEHHVTVVGLVQACHIGRLGHYVEMAASEGMISMLWAGGFGVEVPATAPYGGRERALHTNPLAMGFPGGEAPPMMFDFATTAVSGVKVLDARRRGVQLPAGCLVDKDGVPSTDPNDYFDGGAYLPFGGHKGYALMMAVEFLGRIFTGSDTFTDVGRGGAIMGHQGVTMIVLKADLFRPFAAFTNQVNEMGDRIRGVAPAPGFGAVLMPGDPESRTRAARKRDGIPIADDVWESIVGVAASLNVRVS